MKEILLDKVKIALGRKLSPSQKGSAVALSESERWRNYYTVGDTFINSNGKPNPIDFLGKNPSGEFVRRRQGFKLETTPDASFGSRILHTNWDPYGSIKELYNEDGLLTEKFEERGALRYSYESTRRVYNPPGRFFGRKVKEKK